MNPGWNNSILFPEITGHPHVGLTDYAVKEKMFVMYLNHGCLPLTSEHALMTKIAGNNPWPKPIAVMGYNNALPAFGGDTFEAETKCTSTHNMGQIASDGFNNFSYFTNTPRISEPLV